MKVIAVVVTYNRLELLQRTVACLQGQTRPLDALLVVNNGSTDGTAEWLATQDDSLHVITQTNTGGSGGFHTGIREAFIQEADWISRTMSPTPASWPRAACWRAASSPTTSGH